jgi:hypothetical protein
MIVPRLFRNPRHRRGVSHGAIFNLCNTSGKEEFMSERKPTRGMDHVGITVPDLDVASRFLTDAARRGRVTPARVFP